MPATPVLMPDSVSTLVNTFGADTTDPAFSASDPSVAALDGGGFVIVWQSANQDGDGSGIYGQRYDADGTPSGSEFRINTFTAFDQTSPEVAGLPDGGFVVTWQSDRQDGSDGGIYMQRYAADGQPVGGETQVSSAAASDQSDPQIIVFDDGAMLIGWTAEAAGSTTGTEVWARGFNANGSAAGDAFQINQVEAYNQGGLSLVALDGHSFAAAWAQPFGTARSGGPPQSMALRFFDDLTGTGDNQIDFAPYSSWSRLGIEDTSLLRSGSGELTLIWSEQHWGRFYIGGETFAQNFDLSGTRVGDIHSLGSGQAHDAIDLADGGALVVQDLRNNTGYMPPQVAIAGGTDPQQADIALESPLSGFFAYGSDVVILNDGTVVIAWNALGSLIDYDNPVGSDIVMQMFRLNNFAEGTVTVTGNAVVGQELGAALYEVTDADGMGNIQYQWYAGDTAIAGATTATYVIDAAHTGQQIWVEASFVDGAGAYESLSSERTDAVLLYLVGNSGDDSLSGTSFGDILEGGAGNDTLNGNGGADTLSGGDDNDLLFGGALADSLSGDAGDDTIYADAGDDTVAGGDGDDRLFAEGGDDTVDGGSGIDRISLGAGLDLVRSTVDGLNGDTIIDFEENESVQLQGTALPASYRWVHEGGTSTLVADFDGDAVEEFSLAFLTDLASAGLGFVERDGDLFLEYLPLQNYLGTGAADRFDGTEFDDMAVGLAGHDTLAGAGGNDRIDGGEGDDHLFGGLGNDTLNGGLSGNDSIDGNEGNDVIEGGNGNDTLSGGPGDDVIDLGAGSDMAGGGDGNDSIVVGRTNVGDRNTIWAGAGNDSVAGGDGHDVIWGGAGRDTLEGRWGNDTIYGSDGSDGQGDEIFGDEGDDSLIGGNGDDIFHAGAGDDTVHAGPGHDSIYGSYGDDVLSGGAGDDILTGDEGNDSLDGGDGIDRIHLGAGSDTAFGAGGNDSILVDDALTTDVNHIWAGAGGDLVTGNVSKDVIYGEDGADTLIGNDGDDTLVGGASTADLRDMIYGGNGDDSIDGGYGNDELRGDAGNDTIIGGFGADTVIGGDGDDQLTGQAYGDELFGGAGADFINGGFGHDRVNGGTGADRFFHLGVAGHGSDWVQDYNAAEGDVLMFNLTVERDQFQVNFSETANAGQAGIEEAFVIYRPTGQILWALVDGAAQSEINLLSGGVIYDVL